MKLTKDLQLSFVWAFETVICGIYVTAFDATVDWIWLNSTTDVG